jgi:hypothetical protein
MAAWLCCAALLAACGDDYVDFDASVPKDAGGDDQGASVDGGIPVGARFTVVGCDTLVFDDAARPLCTTSRNRALTFIALGAGVQSLVWTFPGGTPPSSTLASPEVSWAAIGNYAVTLATAGGGGTALGDGSIKVVAVGAGGPCSSDGDCDTNAGLTCLCPAGSDCPAGLAAGLCARRCEDAPCIAGEVCANLTLGGAAASLDGGSSSDGGANDVFRVRVCLASCGSTADCRTGFSCDEIPVNAAGSLPDAPYHWELACFASVLRPVGAACRDIDGSPNGSSCLTGLCEPLGAKGVCSEICDDAHPCPSHAVCATLPSVGARCLAKCTDTSDCDDPRMACLGAGAGGLGFALPAGVAPTTTLCAPKRCSGNAECGAAGTCQTVDGADFCLP